MKRDYHLFLQDIVESINSINEFINGLDYEEFLADDKTASAVVRKIEVIGEAAKNIPGSIRKRYGNVPWAEMAKMRDKIIHSYFKVDYEIVWRVIVDRFPGIKQTIMRILDDLED